MTDLKNPKRYGVIIADPPWSYRRGSGVQGAVEDEYVTTRTADLAALPVADLAARDCVLLMWATWPQLADAMALIDAWGFEHVTGFPWVKIHGEPRRNLFGELEIKPRYGIGYWVRGCSEPILVCRRGKPSLPTGDALGLLSENFGHSRKPDNLHEYAETLGGPYLEMFARRPRKGWDVWGNEAPGCIDWPSSRVRV